MSATDWCCPEAVLPRGCTSHHVAWAMLIWWVSQLSHLAPSCYLGQLWEEDGYECVHVDVTWPFQHLCHDHGLPDAQVLGYGCRHALYYVAKCCKAGGIFLLAKGEASTGD